MRSLSTLVLENWWDISNQSVRSNGLLSTSELRSRCSVRTSLNRDWAHGESGGRASDLVGHGDVTKFVNFVVCHVLQVVKFCDVHTLVDQQILVHCEKSVIMVRWGFKTTCIGSDHNGAMFCDEVLSGGQIDTSAVVIFDKLMVATILLPEL